MDCGQDVGGGGIDQLGASLEEPDVEVVLPWGSEILIRDQAASYVLLFIELGSRRIHLTGGLSSIIR